MKKYIKYISLFTLLFVLYGCGSSLKLTLMPSIDTVEINESWVDPGAKIKIDKEDKLVYSLDKINTSVLGTYRLNYRYMENEKTYSCIRYVIVVDQTKPIISLNQGVDTISKDDVWIDAGAEVTDNSKETLSINVSGNVDVNKVGTYEIKYEAIDSSGNKTTVIRYVDVID